MPHLLLSFLLMFIAAPVTAAVINTAASPDGKIKAALTVTPDNPTLADTITLTLTVECPDADAVSFPPFGESLGELTITNAVTTDRQLVLTAIPQHAGKTPIWAITITCGSESVTIPPSELEIVSTVPADVCLDDIFFSPEPPPAAYYFYYIIAACLLAAVILLLLWLYRRRKPVEVPMATPPLSVQDIALQRLAALLESRMYEADVKKFFTELSDIVRWYAERLSGIRVPEMTTEEFLHQIARPAQTMRQWGNSPTEPQNRFLESLETLAPFLEAADIVKFAKHAPAEPEIMTAYRHAETFIQNSRPAS